jgi:hypothetical protein
MTGIGHIHRQLALTTLCRLQCLLEIEIHSLVIGGIGVGDIAGNDFLAVCAQIERPLLKIKFLANLVQHDRFSLNASPSLAGIMPARKIRRCLILLTGTLQAPITQPGRRQVLPLRHPLPPAAKTRPPTPDGIGGL